MFHVWMCGLQHRHIDTEISKVSKRCILYTASHRSKSGVSNILSPDDYNNVSSHLYSVVIEKVTFAETKL